MKTQENALHLQKELAQLKATASIGFVPTMGALHNGHLQLVRNSKKENDITVVSLFVNPTQFNNPEDFKKYPKTLEQDLDLLKKEDVDFVFIPSEKEIYKDNYNYMVSEKEKNTQLCGAHRPGHFSGVLTVVAKLLNIVAPHKMYLGEKDYQQVEILKGYMDAFFVPLEVISVPTVRDLEGLALSSRNARLSPSGLQKARFFAKNLKREPSRDLLKSLLEQNQIRVEYIEDLWNRRFAAVEIENVRLIDNVPL